MITVGNFISKARERCDVSQTELSHVLGFKSAQSISNIERGVSPLPAELVRPIAKRLKVRPKTLAILAIVEKSRRYFDKAGMKI